MEKKSDVPVSILILVYNEAETIRGVIEEIHRKVAGSLPDSEFIVAEDGSTDGTKEILAELAKEIPLHLVTGAERKGYTRALIDGLGLARKEYIFFSDSDGQHDPDDFWKLLEKIDDYDLIIGRKAKRADPAYRVFISRVFNFLIGLIFGVWLHDINCGFRIMRREVARDVLAEGLFFKHCVASEFTIRAHRMGYRITEIPVRHKARESGASRGLPLKKIPGAVAHILKNFVKLRFEKKRSYPERN